MPKRSWRTKLQELWKRIPRGARVFGTSVIVSVLIICSAFGWVRHAFFSPVNMNSKEPITLEIELGSSVSSIARKLEDSGVIRNASVFKLMVDVYDRGSRMKAGTYEFSASMTMNEVMDIICTGATTTNVIKVFLPEGGTVNNLADTLFNLGLVDNAQTFIDAMKNPVAFQSFSFLDEAVATKEKRIISMEGYLFPDTYLVYKDASIEQITSKFLTRFSDIFTDDYIQRAEELNMSLDQVLTLASIIQREARTNDFGKVSAVFHNRLKDGMSLGSDVTVQYVLNTSRINLTKDDIAVDSPYNTYKYKGLPPGPICNPGKDAIEAALWPDESYIKEKMLYFCLADPETGNLVFAKTLTDHNKNVERFRPLWIEYDKK